MNILIIGSGVIGLSTAFELALAGHSVKVVTRNYEEGSSWVAGGMLAPYSEGLTGDLLRFSVESLRLYPEFLDRLQEVSRLRIYFNRNGILRLFLSEEEYEEAKRLAAKNYKDTEFEELHGEELRKREPLLSGEPVAGFLFKEEGDVDAEKLMDALLFACENLRVKIQVDEVVSLEKRNGRIESAKGLKENYVADFYILTTGAWSKPLLDLPVYPVKGQILKVKGSELDKVYYSNISYIIPKENFILIGATSEDAGFDSRPTVGGVRSLLEGAVRIIPSLSEAEILSVKVGFRPGTPDDMPIFDAGENYVVSVGHYRNGILWAPISAKMVLDLVEKGDRSPYFDTFNAGRFSE